MLWTDGHSLPAFRRSWILSGCCSMPARFPCILFLLFPERYVWEQGQTGNLHLCRAILFLVRTRGKYPRRQAGSVLPLPTLLRLPFACRRGCGCHHNLFSCCRMPFAGGRIAFGTPPLWRSKPFRFPSPRSVSFPFQPVKTRRSRLVAGSPVRHRVCFSCLAGQGGPWFQAACSGGLFRFAMYGSLVLSG